MLAFKLLMNIALISTERNRYNQAPHLTQDTNGKVTASQLDITNESLEVSPFLAGDHEGLIKQTRTKA